MSSIYQKDVPFGLQSAESTTTPGTPFGSPGTSEEDPRCGDPGPGFEVREHACKVLKACIKLAAGSQREKRFQSDPPSPGLTSSLTF